MLGQDYFNKNLKRLSILQKVVLLFGVIRRERITDGDQLANDVQFLFSRRNDLVHPKCSPIKSDVKPRLHELFYEHEPDPNLLKDYISKFERIIDCLSTLMGSRENLNIPNLQP